MNAESWPADLVPEFEPGKPWKGTSMIKSVDDDPTLTPGSVSFAKGSSQHNEAGFPYSVHNFTFLAFFLEFFIINYIMFNKIS